MVINEILTQTYFGNTIMQYLLFLGVIVGGIILGKIFYWLSTNFIRLFTKKTKTNLDDLLVQYLEKPVMFLIFILGFFYGIKFLTLSEAGILRLDNITEILVTLNIAWFLTGFIDAFLENYLKPMAAKSKTDLDDHLLPIVRKLIKFVIWAITLIMIISKFGYDVSSLVAGLGIGGLAFALAAKDLLGNLFGGVAILADKPFKLRDRIKIGDIDGVVSEIGMRTMQIKTFGGTIITVPNSKVVDSVVENVTKEKARRMVVTLGLEYDTPPLKMEKAKKILMDILKKEKELVHEDSSVYFTNFGASSLDLRVVYWITKEGLKDYWGIQDRINMKILSEFNKAKLGFAYPSQTIYVKK